MIRRGRKQRHGIAAEQAGFTLIETLVAFAVLALMLTVLFGGLSPLMTGGQRAEVLREALQLAQARLDGLGIVEPLVSGESSGHFEDGFDWRLRVGDMHRSARSAGSGGAWVEITVSATAGAMLTPPTVSLISFKLAGAPRT
ncbi:type IV pilus modification PilV family protein [Bradyrhizobium sp. AZCC 1678]|uniref:type IV pilus modification PilV family protein n=1 Tax=Bradyrhizobium sp. AZCC 1678 TaxID=3117030 RepID=UPI002FF01575